jgi:hypothetical protein
VRSEGEFAACIMSVPDPSARKPDDDEDERDRRATNIFLLVAAALFIGAGVWLVDALLAARKADDCMSAGRRNCAPVERLQR